MKAVIVLIGVFIAQPLFASEPFSLKIVREFVDANGIYGHLELNGVEIAKTAERPDNHVGDGKTLTVSLVYVSKDAVVLTEFGNAPAKQGDFLLKFDDAAGHHTALEIHQGNAPAVNSKGCILVGTGFQQNYVAKEDGKTYPIALANTVKALQNLRLAFYGTQHPDSTPNLNITISFAPGQPTHDDAQFATGIYSSPHQPAPPGVLGGFGDPVAKGLPIGAPGLIGPPPHSSPGVGLPAPAPKGPVGAPQPVPGAAVAPPGQIAPPGTPPPGPAPCGASPEDTEPHAPCKLP